MKSNSPKPNDVILDAPCRQLLLCLKAYIAGNGAELIVDAQSEEQKAELFQLAYLHKLLPVVCDTLKQHEALFALPAGAAYRRLAREQAVMQAYYSQSFGDILAELKTRGFEPIVLKGEVCRRLYSGSELRISADEDIFLPEGAEECATALADMGFDLSKGFDENGVLAANSPDGLHIELHKRLFPDGNAMPSASAHLDIASREVFYSADGGWPLRTFRPTEELLYLICHAAKHFAHGGVGVRTLADIACFAERHYGELDTEVLARLLDDNGLSRFASAVFDIAERYFGYDSSGRPADFVTAASKNADNKRRAGVNGDALLFDSLAGGVYGTSTKARAQSAKYTAAAASGGSHAGALVKTLFPARETLAEEYPFVKRSALLVPAAWAARLVKYVRSGRKDAQNGAKLGRSRAALLKQYGLLGGGGDSLHE